MQGSTATHDPPREGNVPQTRDGSSTAYPPTERWCAATVPPIFRGADACESGRLPFTFGKEHHDEHHHHPCRHRPHSPVRRRLGLFPSSSIARPNTGALCERPMNQSHLNRCDKRPGVGTSRRTRARLGGAYDEIRSRTVEFLITEGELALEDIPDPRHRSEGT